jgi:hypothetical protein
MTDIKDLSKEDFETLKQTGLLKKLYPNAPDNFEDIRGKRPIPKKNIDWNPLLRALEAILDDIEEREWNDEDNSVYIKEAVVDAVYGKSWYDFTNKFGC